MHRGRTQYSAGANRSPSGTESARTKSCLDIARPCSPQDSPTHHVRKASGTDDPSSLVLTSVARDELLMSSRTGGYGRGTSNNCHWIVTGAWSGGGTRHRGLKSWWHRLPSAPTAQFYPNPRLLGVSCNIWPKAWHSKALELENNGSEFDPVRAFPTATQDAAIADSCL